MHKARPAGSGERIKARQALHTSCVNASQYLPFYKANINTINHISSPSRAAHTKRVWQIDAKQCYHYFNRESYLIRKAETKCETADGERGKKTRAILCLFIESFFVVCPRTGLSSASTNDKVGRSKTKRACATIATLSHPVISLAIHLCPSIVRLHPSWVPKALHNAAKKRKEPAAINLNEHGFSMLRCEILFCQLFTHHYGGVWETLRVNLDSDKAKKMSRTWIGVRN